MQALDRTYGRLPLGNAELFLLDSRQFRGDQPCNPTDSFLSQPCPPTVTDSAVLEELAAAFAVIVAETRAARG